MITSTRTRMISHHTYSMIEYLLRRYFRKYEGTKYVYCNVYSCTRTVQSNVRCTTGSTKVLRRYFRTKVRVQIDTCTSGSTFVSILFPYFKLFIIIFITFGIILYRWTRSTRTRRQGSCRATRTRTRTVVCAAVHVCSSVPSYEGTKVQGLQYLSSL